MQEVNIPEKTDTAAEIGTCGAQIFLLPYLEQQQVYGAFEESASLDPAERIDPPHIHYQTESIELSQTLPIYIIKPRSPNDPASYVKGRNLHHWASGVVIPSYTCPSGGESVSL